MVRDSATFWDKGTEVPSLSRDKGTMGQAKNLAKGRDRLAQPKFRTGQAGKAKIRDGTRDKTGQRRKGRSQTGTGGPRIFAPALVPGQRDTGTRIFFVPWKH